ncbi:hypothetical protein ACIOJE_19615 [Kitasatospora sp. NPDC087861]|uniref:hypothetical protein n=1 Tax=Kitasatospora sp. NPDC087861 TaxID=3364070 RepID=UPI00381A648B
MAIALTGDAGERLHVPTGPGMDQVLDNVLSDALEVSSDGGTITVRVNGGGTVALVDPPGGGLGVRITLRTVASRTDASRADASRADQRTGLRLSPRPGALKNGG